MSAVLLVCQVLLALIFLMASIGKFLRSEEFAAALRLSHWPESLVGPTVVAVPAAELAISIALLLSPTAYLTTVSVVAIAALLSFTLWVLVATWRGLRVKCGCFGTSDSAIGPTTILRNIVFLALCVATTFASMHAVSPVPMPGGWFVTTVLTADLCVALVVSARQASSALVLSTRSLSKPLGSD